MASPPTSFAYVVSFGIVWGKEGRLMDILKSGSNKLTYKNIINAIILAAYAGIHIFLVLHHEAWRDESQAWVLAYNSTWIELIKLCSSDGHPVLWFFVLKLLQLLHVPFLYAGFFSTALMTIGAAVLLWKSPFKLITNICILISPVFFYYNPVIFRIYCIVVPLFMLISVYWPKRRNKPIIYGLLVAVLFQTHILVSGFAIGCVLEMLLSLKRHHKKNHIVGLALAFLSGVAMVLELRQPAGTETYIHVTREYLKERLQESLMYRIKCVAMWYEFKEKPLGMAVLVVFAVLLAAFVILFCVGKGKRRELFDIGLVSFAGVICYAGIIILVRDAGHPQMVILLWMPLLFCAWVTVGMGLGAGAKERTEEAEKKLKATRLFEALLVLSCLLAFPRTVLEDAVYDAQKPFSGSREIAQVIIDTAPENSVVAIHNDYFSMNIVAYLYDSDKNLRIWDIDNAEEYGIHKWGHDNMRAPDSFPIYDTLCSDLPDETRCYWVYGTSIFQYYHVYYGDIAFVAQNEEPNKWDEYYQLFEVTMNR